MKNWIYFLLVLNIGCNNVEKQAAKSKDIPSKTNTSIVYVGTYTQKLGHVDGKASGIYICEMNNENGALTVIDSAIDIVNPSFLTISPDKKYLYAVGEVAGLGAVRLGKVLSYKITEGGKLLKINELPSYGNAPCHISTDKTGKFVFVANYLTFNIVSYGVKEDGGLTDSLCMVQQKGVKESWAHMIIPTPDNKFILSVNKGADKIFTYTLNEKGILTEKNAVLTEGGAGPRHFDFYMDNSGGFVINENNSTISAFKYDSNTSNLSLINTLSTLPADFKDKNTCADIHIHPTGNFVYGSNRGHNSIAIFKIDEKTGQIEAIGHESTQGEIPRNFMITPDGNLLLVANQNSDNIVAFKIDKTTGKLTPTGQNSRVMTPVCLKLL